jgi:hypothetical protein
LAVLLTVASVGTAQTLGLGGSAAVVAGFQYAFLASTLLSGIGLAIALLIGRKKGSAG